MQAVTIEAIEAHRCDTMGASAGYSGTNCLDALRTAKLAQPTIIEFIVPRLMNNAPELMSETTPNPVLLLNDPV